MCHIQVSELARTIARSTQVYQEQYTPRPVIVEICTVRNEMKRNRGEGRKKGSKGVPAPRTCKEAECIAHPLICTHSLTHPHMLRSEQGPQLDSWDQLSTVRSPRLSAERHASHTHEHHTIGSSMPFRWSAQVWPDIREAEILPLLKGFALSFTPLPSPGCSEDPRRGRIVIPVLASAVCIPLPRSVRARIW